MNMSQNVSRDRSLDVIRALACLLVITMHAPLPDGGGSALFLSSLSYLTAPSIGLFFMVSGALLLPVKNTMFGFLKRRFAKIAVPTLVWSLVYISANVYFSESEIDIFKSLLSIPFSPQGTGVLWFMYTLAGLYLLAPVISPWLEKASRREVEFVLMLWIITLCYPLIRGILIVDQSTSGILYYFTGYAGYFLLGHYMCRWKDAVSWKLLIPLTAVSFIAPVFCKITGADVDFYDLFWYLSVFVVILCAFIFKFCCRYFKNINLVAFSRYTFGIYLCHILVMRMFLWELPFILAIPSYPLQTLAVIALTTAISFGLCWIIARMPFAEYIIGVKKYKSE